MNDQLFGLPLAPFSAVPDVNLFVETGGACEAVHQLTRSLLRDDGIAVLTGEVGVGKTMIGKVLAERVSHKLRPLVLSSSNFPTRRALYQSVLFSLGQDFVGLSEQEARLLVLESSRDQLDKRGNLVLIIDEAHLLTDRLLEELRCLVSNVDSGRLLVQVVLIGHSSLQERLKDPRLVELQHRIGCFAELHPMSQSETTDYVSRRLGLAGRDVFDVISPGALHVISVSSSGYPRCVNTLCDRAIGLAVESESPIVDEAIVRTALAELRQLPLAWNESSLAETPAYHPAILDMPAIEYPAEDEPGAQVGILPLAHSEVNRDEDQPIAVDLSPAEDWASFEIGAEWPRDIEVATPTTPDPVEHSLGNEEFEEIPVFDPYSEFEAKHGSLIRPVNIAPPVTRPIVERPSSPPQFEPASGSSRTSELSDPRWFEEFVEESWPEVSVLEAIHELRAELNRDQVAQAHRPLDEHADVEFDVVEPELQHEPIAVTIDPAPLPPVNEEISKASEQPAEIPANRFAGLFTRLRRKRAAMAEGVHTTADWAG